MMTLKLSKNMKYLLVGFVILIIIGIYMYIRSKKTSTYLYPETDSNVTATNVYTFLDQKVQSCADVFQAVGGDANTPTTDSRYLTYQTCLSSNVSLFMSNICPAVNSSLTKREDCEDPTKLPGSNVYRVCTIQDGSITWNQVSLDLSANLTTIKNAYADITSHAGKTVYGSNTFPSTEAIGYARKADVRGATRQYLARLCPSFYTSNIAGSTSNNPTTLFKGFKSYGYGVADPGGNGYYFTDSNVLNVQTSTIAGMSYEGNEAAKKMTSWARYSGAGTFDDIGIPPTTGYGVTSIWNLPYAAPPGGTGFSATTDGAGTTCNIPNWVIAANFGPGTVLRTTEKIPITWTNYVNGTSGLLETKTCLFTPATNGILFA